MKFDNLSLDLLNTISDLAQIPATALRLHKGSTTVVLDKEAASKLKLTGATHQSV
jgi:6-phosphogluconolactonase/glucosamine-6-phosphate isomerase/deaminase